MTHKILGVSMLENKSDQHPVQPSIRRRRPLVPRSSPRERARAAEAEHQAEVDALIRDLGREPTHVEKLLITEMAALAMRSRNLRRQGKATDDVARLMSRIAAQLGLRRYVPKRPLEPTAAALDRYRELEASTVPAERPFNPAMAPMSVEECLGRPPGSASAGATLAQSAEGSIGAHAPGEPGSVAAGPSNGDRK
jgi:hypothetical protein